MASDLEFVEFVAELLQGTGEVSYKKMFGEYLVYRNGKPVILICDNTAFVKKLSCVTELLASAEAGFPYSGAKEHYILDVDNAELVRSVTDLVEAATPLPKPKKQVKLS